MGVYGIDFFGQGRFGRDPSLILPGFDVSPFQYMALDYATLHLTWQKPASADCTQLRLVRNSRNLPQDENDGAILFTDLVTRPTNLTDGGLGQGFYYYTMWGWSNSESLWIHCTDLIALVPINWGYGYRLYSLLPMAYRDQDGVLVDPYNPWPVNSPRPPLQRFMSLLGFQLDFIRTELESLMSLNDAQNCSGALLPLLAQQFGLPNEPEIGMQQERQLIQNAIHLYKLKGTPRGITEFCSILTSYPMTQIAHHGYNLLLCRDDSIGETSIGTWGEAGGTTGIMLTQNPNMLTGATAVPGMTNPLETYPGFNPGPNPQYNYSGIQVNGNIIPDPGFEDGTTGLWTSDHTNIVNSTAYAFDGTHSLQLNLKDTTGTAQWIWMTLTDIVGGAPYTATYHVLAPTGTPARSTYMTIQWYTANYGTLIRTDSSTPVTETPGSWLTVTWNGTPPTNAVWAMVYITVQGVTTTTEVHYIDGVSLGISGIHDAYLTTGLVPITDFMSASYGAGTITWRIQIWSSVARQVSLYLIGYNGTNTGVSIGTVQTFTETVGHWTMMTMTTTLNPYPNGLNNPAAYYSIWPIIHIAGLATPTESHYLTLMGLWPCAPAKIGVDTPVYDYPRDVKVILGPQYSNLLSNTLTTFPYGFDGVTAAANPLQATTNLTCGLTIQYVTVEDPASLYAVNGNAALQVNATAPNSTVWLGLVNTWTSPPPGSPLGWFADPNNDWFGGSAPGPGAARTWFDPVNGWFVMNNQYFSVGSPLVTGDWFPDPSQPPQNGNLVPFNVAAYQPFNFSVYARYMVVQDPSNAVMQIGFRWYYPDGTWAEVFTTYTLTDQFVRYSCAPPDSLWMANPPGELPAATQPTTMFPFVRFPYASDAFFLLNSAMLAPSVTTPPYMDINTDPTNPDFVEDAHGASYYYRNRTPRTFRLVAELYRWLPMGSSYTQSFGAGATLPPLDPTLW